MKNIFTLMAGALLSVSAFASDVTVTLSNNNKYQVLIDGRNLYQNGYSNNNNTYYLRNLSSGQHNIQVVRTRNNQNNGRWNNGNNNDVVYSSAFSIEPQYDLFIQVDNRGRVTMDQKRSRNYNDNRYGNNGYGNGRDKRDRDRDGDHDNRYDHDRNRNWNNDNGYGNNGGSYRTPMNDNEFAQQLQHIRSQWFGKLSNAKSLVGNTGNAFTTYQVRQVLEIFSSESDRLDLAKTAFRQTVDPNNYRQLYDLFSSNAQADLDNYIRNNRY